MRFISENFDIVGDSYIDCKNVSHRLKDVVAVAFGMEGSYGCLVVLTHKGNDCVIPLSIDVETRCNQGLNIGHCDDLLESARKEFLELVHLASDPRLRLQEGVNIHSELFVDEHPSALEGF